MANVGICKEPLQASNPVHEANWNAPGDRDGSGRREMETRYLPWALATTTNRERRKKAPPDATDEAR